MSPNPMRSWNSTDEVLLCRNTDLLQAVEWYWGDISKDDTRGSLKNTVDGTFLVRNATNSVGDFALAVRKGSSTRLIKIYYDEGMFSFTPRGQRPTENSLRFESVLTLVHHFEETSLEVCNSRVDTRLLYPMSRYANGDADEQGDKDVLKQRLLCVNKEHMKLSLQYSRYQDEQAALATQMQLKKQAAHAFVPTITFFEEQSSTLRKQTSGFDNATEQTRVTMAHTTLMRRLSEIRSRADELSAELATDGGQYHDLDRAMNSMKPRVIELHKRMMEFSESLKLLGVSNRTLERWLQRASILADEDYSCATSSTSTDWEARADAEEEEENEEAAGGRTLPHHDEATWFEDRVIQRAEAERILRDRPPGTFLVRQNQQQQYCLSIVGPATVKHCIIEQGEQGYGFAEPYNIYKSLNDLVLFYQHNTLAKHSDELPIMLQHPAFA
ncbi:PREDICTED: phosphatidylinositol 3-kinase regulatory subunit gamma-like isoform X2 [Priapulus caudatus]|nr:PREDICTED: phosphatidylinositol 3-kinase regulatory subunit gamma-like isoform X2 [Priapulus caudatus]